MNKTFTFGIITGMTSLAIAVPLIMGSVGAQENETTATRAFRFNGEISQEQVQMLIERDEAFLANADAAMAIRKSAIRAHLDALRDALTIEDETARHDAVRAAHDAMQSAMKEGIAANPDLTSVLLPGMGMGKDRGMHDRAGMDLMRGGRGNGMHGSMFDQN